MEKKIILMILTISLTACGSDESEENSEATAVIMKASWTTEHLAGERAACETDLVNLGATLEGSGIFCKCLFNEHVAPAYEYEDYKAQEDSILTEWLKAEHAVFIDCSTKAKAAIR